MSQKKRPARLWLRPDTGTWFIKDGGKRLPTDCREDEVEAAQKRLAEYIDEQYRPQRSSRSAEVTVADIVIVYSEEKAKQTARPNETLAMLDRVNDFFGDMTLTEIKGQTCREYATDRGNLGGARRDLEVLRAAINYYHAEHTLDMVPKITLPEKGTPRQKWLTRQEIARLLRAARKEKQCGHLVRLILIGLYTGTRLSAVLNLQWVPNTNGGHVDLDRGVIYRRAEGERVAHNKRRTPVKIPPRLLRFLRYWHKKDTATDSEGRDITIRYVITYAGEKIIKPHKAFRTIRDKAGFADDVTPHVLRHTRATWLAQAGVETEQAAASLGMTAEEFERTYAHASPDFQEQAANAF
ncbi:tyrosine-type recombinase/integrase [Rhizobium sp. YTU87027]|uniref:tyrosine-type recombinase/integrase n=1 Tax=Rhizobium sp. YTU87027 TaxID=3417741 RepID=UPI003D697938